jgi:hypothetical protein
MRGLAVAMFVIPAAGLLFHGLLYWLYPERLLEYAGSPAIKVVAFLGFANLLGNWFHYRHTRMSLDVLSRVLTYLLILSMVLMLPGVRRTWGF